VLDWKAPMFDGATSNLVVKPIVRWYSIRELTSAADAASAHSRAALVRCADVSARGTLVSVSRIAKILSSPGGRKREDRRVEGGLDG
jgi:hypothetical protein